MQYTPTQIAHELIATALGESYHGNALYVARDFPILTDDDKWVLHRWLDGSQCANDGKELQMIAHKIACNS